MHSHTKGGGAQGPSTHLCTCTEHTKGGGAQGPSTHFQNVGRMRTITTVASCRTARRTVAELLVLNGVTIYCNAVVENNYEYDTFELVDKNKALT